MRADLSHLKQYRFVEQEIRFGGSGSPNFGILLIPSIQDRKPVKVIFSRGFYGWDHVSISKQKHPPSWNEMCWLKGLFFEDDETVMELHPPKGEWISNHDNCLHLWRPVDHTIPMPPPELVGVKGVSSADMAKMSEAERFALQDKAIVDLEVSTDVGRNVSDSEILQTLKLVMEGKGNSVTRQSLVDALQFLVPPKASHYEQAESRLHRVGHSPNVVRVDVPIESRRAPNSPIQATSLAGIRVHSANGGEGLLIIDESHHMKGDTDRMPAELLTYQQQARRNFLARYRDEEDRDDPYNQMLEDEQALADRDRE